MKMKVCEKEKEIKRAVHEAESFSRVVKMNEKNWIDKSLKGKCTTFEVAQFTRTIGSRIANRLNTCCINF